MKHTLTLLTALLLASLFRVASAAGLVVYPPVPGLAAAEHYKVRVRPAGGGEWQSAFAWETACKAIEKKMDAYFDTLAGWTHAYANFEMSGAVEVEITRANGQPIRTAVVHPKRKASACSVRRCADASLTTTSGLAASWPPEFARISSRSAK